MRAKALSTRGSAALVLVAVAVFWVRRSTPIALALAGVLGAVAVTWLALPLPR